MRLCSLPPPLLSCCVSQDVREAESTLKSFHSGPPSEGLFTDGRAGLRDPSKDTKAPRRRHGDRRSPTLRAKEARGGIEVTGTQARAGLERARRPRQSQGPTGIEGVGGPRSQPSLSSVALTSYGNSLTGLHSITDKLEKLHSPCGNLYGSSSKKKLNPITTRPADPTSG